VKEKEKKNVHTYFSSRASRVDATEENKMCVLYIYSDSLFFPPTRSFKSIHGRYIWYSTSTPAIWRGVRCIKGRGANQLPSSHAQKEKKIKLVSKFLR